METTTVAGGVFVALGVAFAWYALRPLAVVPRLLRASVTDPSAVESDAEFAMCRGRAESAGESFAAPFTGTECLSVEYEIDERELTPSEIPFTWSRMDDGVATAPFDLRDDPDRGAVRVAPDSRRFALDTASETIAVSAGDDPPERVRSFVEARGELSPVSGGLLSSLGIGSRRYTERRVDAGGTYLVAGRPEYDEGRTVLTDPLVITDRSPWGVAVSRLRTAAFPLVVALLFCGVGAVLLAIS